MRVPSEGEALCTYYEAIGWHGVIAGYCGIQAHPKARNFIFSIWDHKKHRDRIRAVHVGGGTTTETFGGEGTGLKSWNFKLGWEVDHWYTLLTRAWAVGSNTHCGFWVRSGVTGAWTHLVTMDVAVEGGLFRGGTDAFIEDWSDSGCEQRIINIRNPWKRDLKGKWKGAEAAQYSVNEWDLTLGKRSYDYCSAWDAGVAVDHTGPFYYMVAGGAETVPTTSNPSVLRSKRSGCTRPPYSPLLVTSLKAETTAAGYVQVAWENDASTLPQFGYQVDVYSGEVLVATVAATVPHQRSVTVSVPAMDSPLLVRLHCTDVLDNAAPVVEATTCGAVATATAVLPSRAWVCKHCSADNEDHTVHICERCGQLRASQNVFPEQYWTCSKCQSNGNIASAPKCARCGHARYAQGPNHLQLGAQPTPPTNFFDHLRSSIKGLFCTDI